MPEEGDAPRFVQRGPQLHPVSEASSHGVRILGEGERRRTVAPAVLSLESNGKIPVVQGRDRIDVAVLQTIVGPVVALEAFLVDRTAPLGTDRGQARVTRWASCPSRCIHSSSASRRG